MKYNYNYLLEHQDKVLKTMPNHNSLPVIEYQIKNNFNTIQGINSGTYSNSWEFQDMFNLLENRGIQKIAVSRVVLNE